MDLEFAPGWSVDLERGPDWLFVKLKGAPPYDTQGVEIAGEIWKAMQNELAHRLVIEMHDVGMLRSHLLGELVVLHKRISSQGGLMRLAGLSDENYQVLADCRLHDRFPQYGSREEAVLGYRPNKPR